MGKTAFKRVLRISAWIVGIFLALDLLLVGLLFVPSIQTFVVHKVTESLNQSLGLELYIGKVYITPSLKIVAHDVAIKDHHNENMIYSGTVKGRLRTIETGPFHLGLGDVSFKDLDVVLRTYKGEETLNIAKWSEKFSSDDTSGVFKLTSNKVTIEDGRFVLINDNTRVVYDPSGRPDIDYSFFELADLNIRAKDFELVNDDIAMDIRQLSFNQYGGFRLRECSGDFRINSTALVFDNMKLKTPESDLDMDLAFRYSTWATLGDFLDSVQINAAIRPSTLAMEDVAGFAPAIRGMDEVFHLKADTVDGTVTDFRLRNVTAMWNDRNVLSGDIAIRNVIDILNAYFDVTLDTTIVHLPDLEKFTLPGGKSLKKNALTKAIGTASLSGTFIGNLSGLNTDLQASTGLGAVEATLTTETVGGKFRFNGQASSKNFNLAKLANDPKTFGTCALDVQFDGHTASTGFTAENLSSVQAHLSGDVTRFPVLGYPLRNLHLEGDYQEGLYNATVSADDPNIQLSAIAQFDNTNEVPFLQGSISRLQLSAGKIGQTLPPVDSASAEGIDKAIAFIQRNPSTQLSFDNFQIAMHGSNLDNLNGYFGCDNLKLVYKDDSLSNDRLRLTTFNTPNLHKYLLSSNILNATFESTYPIASVKDSLQEIAHNLFPALVPASSQTEGDKGTGGFALSNGGYVNLNVRVYNTWQVTRLLYPDMFIAPGSYVDVAISADHSDDKVNISLPFFSIRNKVRLHRFTMDGTTVDKALRMNVHGDSVIVFIGSGKLPFTQLNIGATASDNNISYDLSWFNTFNSDSNISVLSGTANVAQTDDIVIRLHPSKIFLKDYKFQFNEQNAIHIKPHRYEIENLVITTQGSSIGVDGAYDTKDSSRMSLAATNIDISLINPLLDGISFGGLLSANLNLVNRDNRRLIYGKIITDELNMNETRLGDLFLVAGLNNENKMRFTGGLFNSSVQRLDYNYLSGFSIRDFQKEANIIANVNGTYENKVFDVRAQFDTLQTAFLEPFLSSFSDQLEGIASGDVRFHAAPDSTYLDGKVHVLDAQLGIAALGTHYNIKEQDILLTPAGISFPNVQFTDKDGNTATLTGDIRHSMFKDMRLDMHITTNRILAINTPRTTNSLFYGSGYVQGEVSISGSGNELRFFGPGIKTLSGSKIELMVSSANSASETDLIQFKPRTELEQEIERIEKETSTNLNFDFTFDVTNDADVVLHLESLGGTLNARADGRFQLLYKSNDGLNLFGNLLLHSGDVKISLFDVVNAKFTLVQGGSINFDGPLENMTVNINAYKSSKASLANIITSENTPSTKVDVNAYIHLNGPLMQHIEPTFSFELPNSSSEVRTLFYTAIDTLNTDNMTKQFAYFLVTNSFMPESMFTGLLNNINGMGLFSNMVNNVLSNVIDSKKASFGITYNQATETTSAEYGLRANANLLQDRVVMSTRIGYYDDRKVTDAYSNIYGDFSVEYLINKAGTWRLKAYTYIGQRDDTHYYDNPNNYVAGVALSYKQNFDIRTRNRNKNKKEVKKTTKKNK